MPSINIDNEMRSAVQGERRSRENTGINVVTRCASRVHAWRYDHDRSQDINARPTSQAKQLAGISCAIRYTLLLKNEKSFVLSSEARQGYLQYLFPLRHLSRYPVSDCLLGECCEATGVLCSS